MNVQCILRSISPTAPFVSLAVLGLLLATAPPVMAGQGNQSNPGVAPPQSKPYGQSYSEWQAAWWQWAISIPFDQHPLTYRADCATGQAGPVWFLGGSFISGTAVRECTVPLGKALFFPVLNAECSTVEPEPFHGDNEAELAACAKSFVDPAVDLFCEIDGVPVQNLDQYRSQSPLFNFTAPDPNVLFVNGQGPVSGQSVGNGFYLMVRPLPVGTHTLHFGGTFPQFAFTLDITYTLTVVPHEK